MQAPSVINHSTKVPSERLVLNAHKLQRVLEFKAKDGRRFQDTSRFLLNNIQETPQSRNTPFHVLFYLTLNLPTLLFYIYMFELQHLMKTNKCYNYITNKGNKLLN